MNGLRRSLTELLLRLMPLLKIFASQTRDDLPVWEGAYEALKALKIFRWLPAESEDCRGCECVLRWGVGGSEDGCSSHASLSPSNLHIDQMRESRDISRSSLRPAEFQHLPIQHFDRCYILCVSKHPNVTKH